MEFESGERGGEVGTLSEGILGIEETMKKEREQDLGGKQKEGHLQEGAKRTSRL